MRQLLRSKKAEGYIDVAVTIMLVAFVLVFAVNMVSLVALNQNVKTIADQLVDYAAQQGTTNISAYAFELREKTGIEFSYSFADSVLFDSTGKVQLGDKIICNVSYNVGFMGFGEATHAVTINASASGISRVYWK